MIWPRASAVGRRLAVEINGGIVAPVAGVVADIRIMDPRTAPRPLVYLSTSRFPSTVRDVVVRVDGSPAAIVPALRAAVRSLDAAAPVYAVTTLPEVVDRSIASDRLTMLLLTGFALSALVLAGVGVFGLFADDVARRRKEIGVRLALGASESGVVTLVLVAAMRRVVVGVAGGAVLAVLLGQAMRSLLFGVQATDLFSFTSVAAAVTSLALVATFVPTWRALKRAPMRSLRED